MNTLLCFAVLLAAQITGAPPQETPAPPTSQQSTANFRPAKPAAAASLLHHALNIVSTPSRPLQPNDGQPVNNSQLAPIDATVTVTPGAAVWLRVSRQRIAGYIERSVNRTRSVHDVIVGTPVTGQSHTTGNVRFVLYPNANHAVGAILFEGKVRAHTTGHNGPAVMNYDSHSTVRAHKQIVLNEAGLTASAAVADAPTQLRPTSVRVALPGLRGRIGQRIAHRRVNASLPRAAAEVADHTADDIRRDLDRAINKSIAAIHATLQAELAGIQASDSSHWVVRSRSTNDFVELALCDRETATKSTPTFEVAGAPDVAVRIHRSTLARLARNPDLAKRLAPILGTVLASNLAGGVATTADRQQPATTTTWRMSGDWIAVDFAPTSEASRIASNDRINEVTLK